MLKDKQYVCDYIIKNGQRLSLERKAIPQISEEVHEASNMPRGIVIDVLNGNKKENEIPEYLLYYLVKFLELHGGNSNVRDFFTSSEIQSYSKRKYKEEKVEFPIRIKCIPVTSDQWIGATNTDFFMNLRKFQMINYNKNAQRTMTKKMVNGTISLVPTVNKTAVGKISNAFDNGDYISDTITLGIVEEANPDFYYDEETCELVINKIDYFDIPDGYHRYLGMGISKEKDNSFVYPMEIRIINFTEDKTKQFIFQQDQKTKMRKVDSNSMNMNSPANIVLERLNDDSKFCFRKQINRNNGKINFPMFATVVDYYYFKFLKKRGQNIINKEIIQTEKELCEGINSLSANYNDLLDIEELNMQQLMLIGYLIKNRKINNVENYFKRLDNKEIEDLFKYKTSASAVLHNAIEDIVK